MSEHVLEHYVWVCDVCGKTTEGEDSDDYPDDWEYADGEDRCDGCNGATEIPIRLP